MGELETDNVMRRAILPEFGLPLKAFLSACELDLILQAMTRTHGNKTLAASLLGINRTALLMKLKRRGISWQKGGITWIKE